MTAQSIPAPAAVTREAPALGGFNLTVLKLEVRRLLRNRRTVIFSVLAPVVLFLAFGLNKAYASQSAGTGSHGNVSAFIMISMALYGAVLATTSGGAMVSIERAAGWSRQLQADPAVIGRVHHHQDPHRDDPGGGLRHRGLCGREADREAQHAGLPVDRHRAVCLGRVAGVRGLRPVHGLPAAHRERHADPRLRADAALVRGWPVHPAEPIPAHPAGPGRVHPALQIRRGASI